MVAIKTATLNLRIDPLLKEMLRSAAVKEHRSLANMVEQMIREHCTAHGIPIPEQQEMFDKQ
jgi:predicted HicB family RNase H-like nuclease